MRKLVLAVLLLALLAMFGGCAPQVNDPLLQNEATDVPGLSMNVKEASTLNASTTTAQVTLYFRYLDEPALAAEEAGRTSGPSGDPLDQEVIPPSSPGGKGVTLREIQAAQQGAQAPTNEPPGSPPGVYCGIETGYARDEKSSSSASSSMVYRLVVTRWRLL